MTGLTGSGPVDLVLAEIMFHHNQILTHVIYYKVEPHGDAVLTTSHWMKQQVFPLPAAF